MIKSALITTMLTMLMVNSAYSGWNEIEQPFEGVVLEHGDKSVRLNDIFLEWVRITIPDKKTVAISRLIGSCEDRNYHFIYRDIIDDDNAPDLTISELIKPDQHDLMYNVLTSVCQPVNMCKPDSHIEENLDRTQSDEIMDIFKDEFGWGDL